MITPFPDQIEFTNKIIRKLSEGYTRVCCQASTGFGKTVVFSFILSRYLSKHISAKICILVHREELQEQTKKMLQNFGLFGISVEMVETFHNKLKKNPEIHFDMLIVDETHRGEFFKVIDHYKPNQKTIILGFTATPISSDKKKPLKNYYQTIVCATDINTLIKLGRLTPPIHYSPTTELYAKSIKKNSAEYNMKSMGVEFSKPRLVEAVVDAYKKYADGKKMLVYNTTIEHSNLVNECFRDNGYMSRSIDSESLKKDKNIRKDTLKWLRETPGAILNNCGILTTGFDDTTLEGQIFNRKTKSLPLWIQCGGRPARVLTPQEIASGLIKDSFLIIDLGDNINGEGFGHWNERHDWEQYFFHPDKSKEGGVSPMKVCPECDARIYMSSTECRWCGHKMPRETVYTDMVVSLSILPEKGIKRNSHNSLMKAIEISADRIKSQRISVNEKRELMFYAFKSLYQASSFEPRTHIISHLVSVYGK